MVRGTYMVRVKYGGRTPYVQHKIPRAPMSIPRGYV